MVAPAINDGSPVHGYNLFKYHTHGSNLVIGSCTGSILAVAYSYLSGTAVDALLVDFGIMAPATAVADVSLYVWASGANVANTAIGSLFAVGGNGEMDSSMMVAVTGSLNQNFDVNFFTNTNVVNTSFIKFYRITSC